MNPIRTIWKRFVRTSGLGMAPAYWWALGWFAAYSFVDPVLSSVAVAALIGIGAAAFLFDHSAGRITPWRRTLRRTTSRPPDIAATA